MREILFRGKRLSDGGWADGNLSVKKCGVAIITPDDTPLGKYGQVDPATVGQYTGLTDKNGKRIFEGDILKGDEYPYKAPDGTYNYYAEVVWFDDCSAFGLYTFKSPQSKVMGISNGLSDYMEDFAPCMWEVIGNIHDNPELLGGETDG